MRLSINNIPLTMGYDDITSFIQNKCGSMPYKICNLESGNRGSCMEVEIADECDAAILMRQLNGIYIKNSQLLVQLCTSGPKIQQSYAEQYGPNNYKGNDQNKPARKDFGKNEFVSYPQMYTSMETLQASRNNSDKFNDSKTRQIQQNRGFDMQTSNARSSHSNLGGPRDSQNNPYRDERIDRRTSLAEGRERGSRNRKRSRQRYNKRRTSRDSPSRSKRERHFSPVRSTPDVTEKSFKPNQPFYKSATESFDNRTSKTFDFRGNSAMNVSPFNDPSKSPPRAGKFTPQPAACPDSNRWSNAGASFVYPNSAAPTLDRPPFFMQQNSAPQNNYTDSVWQVNRMNLDKNMQSSNLGGNKPFNFDNPGTPHSNQTSGFGQNINQYSPGMINVPNLNFGFGQNMNQANQGWIKPFGGESFDNANQSFVNANQSFGNVNQPFGGKNKPFDDANQSFGNAIQPFNNVNQSFENASQSFGNANQSFGNANQSFVNANQSFGNGNQSFGNANNHSRGDVGNFKSGLNQNVNVPNPNRIMPFESYNQGVQSKLSSPHTSRFDNKRSQINKDLPKDNRTFGGFSQKSHRTKKPLTRKQIEFTKKVTTLKIISQIKFNCGGESRLFRYKPFLEKAMFIIKSRMDVMFGDRGDLSVDERALEYRKGFPKKDDQTFIGLVLCNIQMKKKDVLQEIDSLESKEDKNPPNTDTKQPLKKVSNVAGNTPEGKIPKYINDDKGQYKECKKQRIEEENIDTEHYILPPLEEDALNSEVDKITEIFTNEWDKIEILKSIKEDTNTTIQDEIIKKMEFFIKQMIKKRILNVSTNLTILIYCIPKFPARSRLEAFLKEFGVLAGKRSRQGHVYVATVDSFENYDKILALKSIELDGITMTMKPYHLTGNTKEKRAKKGKYDPESIPEEVLEVISQPIAKTSAEKATTVESKSVTTDTPIETVSDDNAVDNAFNSFIEKHDKIINDASKSKVESLEEGVLDHVLADLDTINVADLEDY